MNKILGISFVFILLNLGFSNYIKSDLPVDRPDGNYYLDNGDSMTSYTRVFVCDKKNKLLPVSGLSYETINSILGEIYVIRTEDYYLRLLELQAQDSEDVLDYADTTSSFFSTLYNLFTLDLDLSYDPETIVESDIDISSRSIFTKENIDEIERNCVSMGEVDLFVQLRKKEFDDSDAYMVFDGYYNSNPTAPINEIAIKQYFSYYPTHLIRDNQDNCGVYENVNAPYGFIKHIYLCKSKNIDNDIYNINKYDEANNHLLFQLKKTENGIKAKLPKYDGYYGQTISTDIIYEYIRIDESDNETYPKSTIADSLNINTQKIINDLTPTQINQVILEDKDTGLIIFDENLNTLTSDDRVKKMRDKELELKKLKQKSEDSFINNAEIGLDVSASGGIDIGLLDADASVSTEVQSSFDRELVEKYIDKKVEVEDYQNRITEGNNFEKTACLAYINIYNQEQILICQKYTHPVDQDHLKYIPRKLDNFVPYIGYDSESVF